MWHLLQLEELQEDGSWECTHSREQNLTTEELQELLEVNSSPGLRVIVDGVVH